MQFDMRVSDVALELVSIEPALFELRINSVDLVRHRKKIATGLRF